MKALMLVILLMSSASFGADFECDDTAYQGAIKYLTTTPLKDFATSDGPAAVTNSLNVIQAYVFYLKYQMETDLITKQILLHSATQTCNNH